MVSSIQSNLLTSLHQLSKDFKEADSGKFLRGDNKFPILHTSSTVGGAITGFLAKIGLTKQNTAQTYEREKGAEMVKNLINQEFREPGLADKLFDKIKEDTGRDLNTGVTVGDLATLRDLAKTMNSGNNNYEAATVSGDLFIFKYEAPGDNAQKISDTPKINIPDDHIKLAGEHKSILDKLETDKNESANKEKLNDKFKDLQFRVLERKADELVNEIEDFMDKNEVKEGDDLHNLMQIIDEIETQPNELTGGQGHVNIDDISSDDILNMIGEIETERKDAEISGNKFVEDLLDNSDTKTNNKSKKVEYAPIIDWDKI